MGEKTLGNKNLKMRTLFRCPRYVAIAMDVIFVVLTMQYFSVECIKMTSG